MEWHFTAVLVGVMMMTDTLERRGKALVMGHHLQIVLYLCKFEMRGVLFVEQGFFIYPKLPDVATNDYF